MKKILFFGGSVYGYDKMIYEALEETLEAKAYRYNFKTMEPKYKNIFEKLYDEVCYSITGRRLLKDKRRIVELEKLINEAGNIDYVFVVGGYRIKKNIFEYIGKMKVPRYIHFWDSCNNLPYQRDMFKYFDHKSIYDKGEAEQYNLSFVPNFYNSKNVNLTKVEKKYDVFTVMSYNERFGFLEKIAKNLKERGIKYCFIVKISKKNPVYMSIKDNEYIKVVTEGISIEEMYDYISKSKAMLEVGYNLSDLKTPQGGLSFRAIEALGNEKKLITTFDIIKDYDFYCKENIRIISEKDYEIEKEFLDSDYKKLSKEMYDSYNEKSWIKKIFKDID